MLKKPQQIKSKKIRDFARGKPCTLRIPGVCSGERATSCACHVNTRFKGLATKSPDLFTVIGCARCHAWMDGGYTQTAYSKARRDQEVLRALTETQMRYVQAGLIVIN